MPWLTMEAVGSTLGRGSLNEGEAAGQTQRYPSSYHRCHLRGSLPSSHHHPAFPKHTSSILLWVSVCIFFWNILPPDICLACFLASFRSELKMSSCLSTLATMLSVHPAGLFPLSHSPPRSLGSPSHCLAF